MRAADVFTPGKLPAVTYISDHLVEPTKLLLDTMDAGAQAIALSGPSKSGKTVFVEKNLGKQRLIIVTGAGINSPSDLWEKVFSTAKIQIKRKTTRTTTNQNASGGKAGISSGFANADINSTRTKSDSDSTQIISKFANTDKVIFIDDFHYIPKDTQTSITNQIKEAIRQNVNFILASVPYHSDDAVRANSDLRGRSVNIDFNYWDRTELSKIAVKGFEALNIKISDAYITALTDEAAGSPQLMQALCLNTCYELNLREKQAQLVAPTISNDLVEKVCRRTATITDYSSTVNKMKEGPKTRGQDRNGHLLKTGEILDVYPLIIKALALPPPQLTIRYPTLQQRISSLCANGSPSGSSVTGACAHMCAIANESENRSIVEWDGDTDVFDIRDPYLLFYIRWGAK